MTTLPTRAYDLLEQHEKEIVENYVRYVVTEQNRLRERIIHALHKPIPYEYLRRSKDALYKPLLRAALSERIKEEADAQDISPSRVIAEYASIAFSQFSDYVKPGGFGEVVLKPIGEIEPEKMRAVKSIETKPGMYGVQTKLTLHDKLPALKAMAEMMGLIAPDKPPPLQEYVTPLTVTESELDKAPEVLYAELLK
jgi:hypothetical protein